MKTVMLSCALMMSATAATAAWAEDPKGGGMDMSKMGPWTRKPTDEAKTKKEIVEFFKAEEELAKKGDFEAVLGRIDFPVFMLTDDAKGTPEAASYDRAAYAEMMKPMYENMPKDLVTTHKPTVTVLSDSLVNVTDDFTMTVGKQKLTGRNMTVLVKRDGQWKWKVMGEAGWGGMSGPPADAGKPAAAKPAASPAATKK